MKWILWILGLVVGVLLLGAVLGLVVGLVKLLIPVLVLVAIGVAIYAFMGRGEPPKAIPPKASEPAPPGIDDAEAARRFDELKNKPPR